ncbi:MAG: cytochrome P450 [Thermoproteota archaeon]|nr:cytochrome P450 [Thermoproteota archaeon]
MSFNIFTVYKSLYEEIPIAKRIADTKIALARQNYTITGSDEDIKMVKEFFAE